MPYICLCDIRQRATESIVLAVLFCAGGPSCARRFMLFFFLHGRLTSEKGPEILDELARLYEIAEAEDER